MYVGPSAPPQDVTTMVINSTSISVYWNPPPLPDQNGNIIGYQLMITNQNRSNSSAFIVNITNVTSYVAISLQEFEVYSFKIAAMTAIGLGPFSDAVTNQTSQGGKCSNVCCTVSNIMHTTNDQVCLELMPNYYLLAILIFIIISNDLLLEFTKISYR